MGRLFRDREDAAQRLSPLLAHLAGAPGVVVLGIPRGGLIVAAELARRLKLPLDAVFAKKIGHPLNAEYAIGVVTPDAARLSPDAGDVPADFLEGESARLRGLLAERRRDYLSGRKPVDLRGKTALVVDDGAATGMTMLAALDAALQAGAARVLAAAPAASEEAARRIEDSAEAFYRLETRADFLALGDFYEDFRQIGDEEARAALSLGRAQAGGRAR